MRKFFFFLFAIINLYFFSNDVASAEKITVDPHSNLQSIIDNAEEGDVVVVKKGHYHGNLVIDKPVELIGEQGAVIVGEGTGNVIEIAAPNVTISNFIIKNSGKKDDNSGIFIRSSNNVIKNNTLKNVHFGIYIQKGHHNEIVDNSITGYNGHFSQKGNGIHLFYAEGTKLIGNKINSVQDGVYFDFAIDTLLQKNYVEGSRYAYHVMYAKNGVINENIAMKNITGLMIMGAKDFEVQNNVVTENLDFRGHGILIFDSDRIQVLNNYVTFNNTGISMQDARSCTIEGNVFAGNYIGLDLKNKNEGNTMIKNNFVGNIMQTKIFTKVEPMDADGQGNYWDDYTGIDFDGDGIGEIPYESGKLFDKLVEKNPMLQFFFESPAIKLWASIEKIFPAFSGDKGMDRFPYVHPVKHIGENDLDVQLEGKVWALFAGLIMISIGSVIFYRGRALK
ncbi:nitrous oxide reductase family maturation protein NosD [Calidifontibacillus erzurumensis]|uniref:Nitrous oxide reductase family maturation protein NosD n=1 Tax=Calidifontibacillus erzurumensis TaxID=2741433 RepID=A0A8J8GFW2_9BACI|nr:nitrous oxide reductase family maturation protein NosD [Calidifontibacillus erzurumensis]NSL51663.1 nitrous oxide reductase family maturation protein NosD [Calidifontibacillus erzurumensis]